MSARTVIEHALRAYYVDSAEPAAIARDLLAQYDAERDAERRLGGEEDTRGGSPQQGESTHRHPRPCEFPTVLPCTCPRPSALPDASFARARHRARMAVFFNAARAGRARVWSGAAA